MINIEQIEHILEDYNGKPVLVVVSFFGSVSLSVMGIFSVMNDVCPRIYSLTGMISLVFHSEDVEKIEAIKDANEHQAQMIIRLKGPHDYASIPTVGSTPRG